VRWLREKLSFSSQNRDAIKCVPFFTESISGGEFFGKTLVALIQGNQFRLAGSIAHQRHGLTRE
jgi:hypothetical protein